MLIEAIEHSVEERLLDEYLYQQNEVYLHSLCSYDAGLVKAVESNFREKEWSFNHAGKEWSNEKLSISFRGPLNPSGL
jgi:hypothetical protein